MIKKEQYGALYIDSDTAPGARKSNAALGIHNMEAQNTNGAMGLNSIADHKLLLNNVNHVTAIYGYSVCDGDTYMLLATSGLMYIVKSQPNLLLRTFLPNWYIGLPLYPEGEVVDFLVYKENDNIIKAYWVHPSHPMCFVNLNGGHIFGMPIDPFPVKEVTLSKPITTVQVGGDLTTGRIQYVWAMFNLHEGASRTSTPSDMISIRDSITGEGGKENGDNLDISVRIELDSGDDNYDFVAVYSIKYNGQDSLPIVTEIFNGKNLDNLVVIDDGNSFIRNLTLTELQNLGSDAITAKTLSIKNNIMFIGAYKTTSLFIEETFQLDCRMYGYDSSGVAKIKMKGGSPETVPANYSVPLDHDCINTDPLNQAYQKENNSIKGYEGKYFKLEFVGDTVVTEENQTMSLKTKEFYRIGLVFRDKYGSISNVLHSVDIKVPSYYGWNVYRGLKLVVKDLSGSDFLAMGAVNVELAIVKREPKDRSFSAIGFIIPGSTFEFEQKEAEEEPVEEGIYPYFSLKLIRGAGGNDDETKARKTGNILHDFGPDSPYQEVHRYEHSNYDHANRTTPKREIKYAYFFNSDIGEEKGLTQSYDKVSILGIGQSNDVLSMFVTGKSQFIKYKLDGTKDKEFFYDYIRADSDLVDGAGNLFAGEVKSEFKVTIDQMFKFSYFIPARIGDTEDLKYRTRKLYSSKERGSIVEDFVSIRMRSVFPSKRVIYHHDTGGSYSQGYKSYNSAECYTLIFEDDNWSADPVYNLNYSKFALPTDLTNASGLPLIQLERDNNGRYGGDRYSNKRNNIYTVKGGAIELITGSSVSAYIGDTYLAPLRIPVINTDGGNIKNHTYTSVHVDTSFKVEHDIDVNSRYDVMKKWNSDSLEPEPEMHKYRAPDLFLIDDSYKAESVLSNYRAAGILFDSVSLFPASIMASKVKYPNEVRDSWLDFLPNEVMQLDTTYGDLNKLYTFNDELYSLQSYGTAYIAVQPNIQLQSDSDIGVELGTGQILHSRKYLSTKSGCLSIRSVADDGNIMMYYDGINNTINTIDGVAISASLGIKSLLAEDAPIHRERVQIIHNKEKEEFIIQQETRQLIYSIGLKVFQRTEDKSIHLFPLYSGVASLKDETFHKLYKGNTYLAGRVKYSLAPDFVYDKVFNTIEYRATNAAILDKVEVTDKSNNLGIVTGASLGVKKKFGINRVYIPRVNQVAAGESIRHRFRGTHIHCELTFAATDNVAEHVRLDELVIVYNIKG